MLRYALYARKSNDDRSVTEKSIGEQLIAIDAIAESAKLDVVWRRDESKSAKIPGVRPVFADLMKQIEKGKVEGVAVWAINRLVRNMKEGGELVQLWVDGKLKEIRTPIAVYRTGDNILPLVLEAASSTQYSIDLSRDVKRTVKQNFENGGWSHRVPQGYRNARNPLDLKRGIVERDGHRWAMIERAWNLMATGSYTPQQILRILNNAWGYRTKPTKKQGNTPFSSSAIYALFRNPFYAGFVHCNGELRKGKHEAMVSVETFQRVQAILSNHSFQAPRTQTYTFTGVFRCGYCGSQVTAERKKLRNGSVWETYHCADSKLECTKQGKSLAEVDAAVTLHLGLLEVDPDWLRLTLSEIQKHLDTKDAALDEIAAQQQEALRLCEGRLSKLTEMWMNGLITDPDRYRELETKEIASKNDLTLQVEIQKGEIERMRQNAVRAADFVEFSHEAFRRLGPAQKREIAMALGDSHTFYGKEKRVVIEVKPILEGIVRQVNLIKRVLEPKLTGSHKQKEPAFDKSILFGGAGCNGIELSEELMETLRGPLFPSVDLKAQRPENHSA